MGFSVQHVLRHAHSVYLYARGRGGIEQFAVEKRVRRGRDGYAVVVVQFRASHLAVVDERASQAVQVLDVVSRAVEDDVEVLLGNERAVHHYVAGRVAPHHGERLLGEVEVGAAASSGELAHEGNLHRVAVPFFARLAYDDVAVELDDGAFETLSAYQHFGLVAFGREVLDVPDVVFLYETELFGSDEEGLHHHVAGAFGAYDKPVPRLAVEEVEKFAVADFYYHVAHTGSALFRILSQYKVFPRENQAKRAVYAACPRKPRLYGCG